LQPRSRRTANNERMSIEQHRGRADPAHDSALVTFPVRFAEEEQARLATMRFSRSEQRRPFNVQVMTCADAGMDAADHGAND